VEWLLTDGPKPVLGAAGATLAGASMVAAMTLRHRAIEHSGTVAAVFVADASSVMRVVAIALAVLSASVAFGVEGLGMPLWLVLATIGGAVALGLLAWRWRAAVAAHDGWRRRITPMASPERRVASTAWEIGVIAGGGTGLLTYLATADHVFGHPPHWTLALIGVLLGYAIGIAAVTPRFRFQSAAPKR
jgi:hypothetical protein